MGLALDEVFNSPEQVRFASLINNLEKQTIKQNPKIASCENNRGNKLQYGATTCCFYMQTIDGTLFTLEVLCYI